MFPFCGENRWDCARSCFVGASSFLTAVACILALVSVVRSCIRTRFYRIDMVLIGLGFLQTFLSLLYFLVVEEHRIEFGVKYLRAVQNTLTAFNYGLVALQIAGRNRLVRRVLVPSFASLLLFFSLLFIISCAVLDINCSHPSWLAMSIASAVVCIFFTVAGLVVLKRVSRSRAHPFDSANATRHIETEGMSIVQKRHQLWVLIIVSHIKRVKEEGRGNLTKLDR